MEMPPASAAPGMRGTRRRGPVCAGAAVALLLSREPLVLVDAGHHAVLRIEELLVDGRPSAEVVDREQVLWRRVFRLVHEVLVDRAVALLTEDLLRLVAAREVDELLGLVGGTGGHGDRVLDQ